MSPAPLFLSRLKKGVFLFFFAWTLLFKKKVCLYYVNDTSSNRASFVSGNSTLMTVLRSAKSGNCSLLSRCGISAWTKHHLILDHFVIASTLALKWVIKWAGIAIRRCLHLRALCIQWIWANINYKKRPTQIWETAAITLFASLSWEFNTTLLGLVVVCYVCIRSSDNNKHTCKYDASDRCLSEVDDASSCCFKSMRVSKRATLKYGTICPPTRHESANRGWCVSIEMGVKKQHFTGVQLAAKHFVHLKNR